MDFEMGKSFKNFMRPVVAFLLFLLVGLLWDGNVLAQTPVLVGGQVHTAKGIPVPSATITALGLEDKPARSDSSGAFLITLRLIAGQPVHFHVESIGYTPLDQVAAVAQGVPLTFTLAAIQNSPKAQTLEAFNKGFKIIDKSYRELECSDPPCPTSHDPFQIEVNDRRNPDGTISRLDFVRTESATGSPTTLIGTISDIEIGRLDDDQKAVVIAAAEAVSQNYQQWSTFSAIALSSNGSNQEATHQLVAVGIDMCGNFATLRQVLGNINVTLWDHYASIFQVCSAFTAAHMHPVGN